MRFFDVRMDIKSYASYRSTLRSAVRALWGGEWNWMEFFEELNLAIRTQFPLAWREGMLATGTDPDSMTAEERLRLETEITREVGFVGRFADAIEHGSRENGGKLAAFLKRADLWADGYNRVRLLAMTYAQNDPLMEWVLGLTEHCRDCARLGGKKKRASVWRAADLAPRMWKLACRGVHCECELIPTTGKASPGPLPVI